MNEEQGFNFNFDARDFKFPTKLAVAIGVVALLIIAAVIGVGLYIEYQQYAEIGEQFTSIFMKNIGVEWITRIAAYALCFVLFFINLIFIKGYLSRRGANISLLKSKKLTVPIAIVFSYIVGNILYSGIVDKVLPALNSVAFDVTDPLFAQDLGYYFFQRPFYTTLVQSLTGLVFFLIVITVVLYLIGARSLEFFSFRTILQERGMVFHTITLIIGFFALKAVEYKFTAESILFKRTGQFQGGGYTDVNVWLTFYRIAPYFLLGVVLLCIFFLFRKKLIPAVIVVALYPAALVIVGVIAGAVQTFIVSPNEIAVEAPYLEYNIANTRAAFNLDKMVTKNLNISYDLTQQDLIDNAETVNNIRIIDFPQTLKISNQVQSIRNYYSFNDMDIMIYDINGEKTAVALSAREMNKERLDVSAKNYINLKMKYTHGMGVVMNPLNQITSQGQPQYIIRDIPPSSVQGAPTITQPRIYYGESTDDYVIVGTKGQELDEIEAAYSYSGSSGLPMTLLNRLIYAIRFSDLNLLISDQIQQDSKLLLNRNAVERVEKIAPFLNPDYDAAIVIDDSGKLKWVIDCYTVSDAYPYAQSYSNINYIRNSVKAVVDAYDGTVKFYIIDETDKVAQVYANIYPTLFEKESFPEDLRKHMRYPEALFTMQSNMLLKYNIVDVEDFYQKRGMWAVSREKYETNGQVNVAPYYNMMKLGIDGADEAELVLMMPYTLVNKDNMVAWLAVRCGADNYGQLVNYRFPEGENVYGTYQIENRIDTDPSISQEMTLWSQGGSSVVRGNLLVIPIKDSLLYVEPMYISSGADERALPELKRIIVAYGDKVVSRPTLTEALTDLFGKGAVAIPSAPNVGTDETEQPIIDAALLQMLEQAISNFTMVKDASQSGDWEGFGKAMQSLEETINAIEEQTK